MRHSHHKFALLFSLLMPVLAQALPSDREQAINIEADHAQMDDKAGITQYKGDAILTQGTLRIAGDIITFYYDDKKQLTKVITQGKLASYSQIQKQGEAPVKANALQMEYDAKTQKIYLLGQGHIWQNGNESRGNRIEYDINNNVVKLNSEPVKVNGQSQKTGRVHIIIQPPQSTTKSSSQPENTTKQMPKQEKSDGIIDETKSQKHYPTATSLAALNIRTGPDTRYAKIAKLAMNDSVTILTEQKQWVQIRANIDGNPVIGWVNRRYLAESN